MEKIGFLDYAAACITVAPWKARAAVKSMSPLTKERGQATAEVVIACALCLALCAAFIAFKNSFADGVHHAANTISKMFSGLHGGSGINTTPPK